MSDLFTNATELVVGAQEIVVDPATGNATVVNSGPVGPRGFPGAYGGEVALQNHVDDQTPHPVYDDIPSLTLLFENGLL